MGGKNLSSKSAGDVTWQVIENRIDMRFTLAANESVCFLILCLSLARLQGNRRVRISPNLGLDP